jgi:hypothetical protein
MSIVDAIESLLESKDLAPDVETYIECACTYMQIALARMEVEAAVDAGQREKELQLLLPLAGFQEPMLVDKHTGEVLSQ